MFWNSLTGLSIVAVIQVSVYINVTGRQPGSTVILHWMGLALRSRAWVDRKAGRTGSHMPWRVGLGNKRISTTGRLAA